MRAYLYYLPVVLVVFFFSTFSPFVLCILYFFLFYKKYEVSNEGWVAIIVLSTIAVGAINAVKVPDNDLEQYIYLYHLSKDMPLFQYIWVGSTAGGLESVKEPFYPVIVWLINRICFDNEVLFQFFFTIICYLPLNLSVLAIGKKNKVDSQYILFGIFLMTFIPYIFTLSMQILRQFLAGSIFMLILSLRCFYYTKIWKICLMSLLMTLIHSSSLFFIPFLFLRALDKKWTEEKMWYAGIVIFFILIQLVSLIMMGFLGGDNSFGYALGRASQNTEFESEGLGGVAIALLLIIICFSYYFSDVSSIKDNPGIRRLFNVPLFLGFFVLINLNQKELALRMLFFLYPFVPIIAMFYAKQKEINSGTLMIASLSVLLFFLFYLDFGTWTYEIPFTVFFTPLICYLM